MSVSKSEECDNSEKLSVKGAFASPPRNCIGDKPVRSHRLRSPLDARLEIKVNRTKTDLANLKISEVALFWSRG